MGKKKKVAKEIVKKEVEEENEVSSDDEELIEAEESLEDFDEPEFIKEDSGEVDFSEEIPEGNLEVSDFSIGDVGLATADVETPWRKNLENSLVEEFSNKWEERNKERERESVDEGVYGVNSPQGNYDEESGGRGLYSGSKDDNSYTPGGGTYNVDSAERLTDIKGDRGEKRFWDETRLPGMSRLENKRLNQIGGVFVEGFNGEKRKDRKYD